jgi:hypothetical protein
LATLLRKWVSFFVNTRGASVCAPNTPKGFSLPEITTVIPLITLCSSNRGEVNLVSVRISDMITGPPVINVYPACEPDPALILVRPTRPSFQPAPVRSNSSFPSGSSSSSSQKSTPRIRTVIWTTSFMREPRSGVTSACWPKSASASCWISRAFSSASIWVWLSIDRLLLEF